MASHGIARTNRTRTEEQRQQDLDRIKKYRNIEDQIREQVKDSTNYTSPDLLALTTKLLRLNPEYYTIWNVRRHCLTSGSLCRRSAGSWRSRASPSSSASDTTTPSSAVCSPSTSAATLRDRATSPPVRASGGIGTTADGEKTGKEARPDGGGNETLETQDAPTKEQEEAIANTTQTIQSELSFTIPLLVDFPKCYWIWHYRAWLLSQSIQLLPLPVARQIWTAELGLCSKMLTKDRRNFHAWDYRRNLVATLESRQLDGTSMAEHEFEYTTKMIRMDLSNFSAWHSRAGLIVRVLDERDADDESRKQLLEEELNLVKNGLNVGPEDQSLWFYHQFLVGQLTVRDTLNKSKTIAPALTLEERIKYLKGEIAHIGDLLQDYDDVKGIYEALLRYTLALMAMRGDDSDNAESQKEVHAWLTKLRTLDPMRNGRWDDVEKMLPEA